MAEYLCDRMREFDRAQEHAEELGGGQHAEVMVTLLVNIQFLFFFLLGAVWRSVRLLATMRKDKEELKVYTKQLELAHAGVDPRSVVVSVAHTPQTSPHTPCPCTGKLSKCFVCNFKAIRTFLYTN